jgi:hypothetical protein
MNERPTLSERIVAKRMLHVLKFYANADNYIFTMEGKGVAIPEDQSIILQDMGDEARQLLKLLGEKV